MIDANGDCAVGTDFHGAIKAFDDKFNTEGGPRRMVEINVKIAPPECDGVIIEVGNTGGEVVEVVG